MHEKKALVLHLPGASRELEHPAKVRDLADDRYHVVRPGVCCAQTEGCDLEQINGLQVELGGGFVLGDAAQGQGRLRSSRRLLSTGIVVRDGCMHIDLGQRATRRSSHFAAERLRQRDRTDATASPRHVAQVRGPVALQG